MKIFEQSFIGNIELQNKIIMPPMCMYASDNTGVAKQFHFQHYGARAVGGVGLIIQEATAVNKNGRISNKDLGIWDSEEQQIVLKNLVSYVKLLNPSVKIMVQLAHAGRKVESNNNDVTDMIAPSAIKFSENSKTPREMSLEDIKNVKNDFVNATKKAIEAGYDGIEIHAAHGYLLNSFLSSISNKRTDNYGGNIENRVRIVREILEEIRTFYPKNKVISIRVSAVDYSNIQETLKETLEALKYLEPLVDTIHVSSGGVTITAPKTYPLYQLEFAKIIKKTTNKPVIAVGLITKKEEAEYIVQSNSADFVALGRELIRNPYWAHANNPKARDNINMSPSYKRAF